MKIFIFSRDRTSLETYASILCTNFDCNNVRCSVTLIDELNLHNGKKVIVHHPIKHLTLHLLSIVRSNRKVICSSTSVYNGAVQHSRINLIKTKSDRFNAVEVIRIVFNYKMITSDVFTARFGVFFYA